MQVAEDQLRADQLRKGDLVYGFRDREYKPVREVERVDVGTTHVVIYWAGGKPPTRVGRGCAVDVGLLFD